jgi:hypothetical protein
VGGNRLYHPYPVFPRLYKLIIYGKGGGFQYHMDAPHSPGMIMTFSVDLWCGKPRVGGLLSFEERAKESVPQPKNGAVAYTLFYHDVNHRVSSVSAGWKMSLVFDVFQGTFSAQIPKAIPPAELPDEKADAHSSASMGSMNDVGDNKKVSSSPSRDKSNRTDSDADKDEESDDQSDEQSDQDVSDREVSNDGSGNESGEVSDQDEKGTDEEGDSKVENSTGNDETESNIQALRDSYATLSAEIIGGLKTLKNAGVERVGFLLNHSYMCPDDLDLSSFADDLSEKVPECLALLSAKYANKPPLKGMDKVLSMVMGELGLTPTVTRVSRDGDGQIFDSRLISIFRLDSAFEILFNAKENNGLNDASEAKEFGDSRSEYSEGTNRPPMYKSQLRFSPSLDTEKEFEILCDSCLFGDIFFVTTCPPNRLTYSSNEEAHLGNEGFEGTIYSNLAMIVNIESWDPTAH